MFDVKRKLNFVGKLVIFILVIIGGSIGFILHKNHSLQEKHILKETKNYSYKISYPIYHKKKIDKPIQTMIDTKKQEFLEQVNSALKDNATISYDFLVEYNKMEWKNISITHFIVQAYTGGSHYTREDISYYYDTKAKKLISPLDLLTQEGLNSLSQLAYYQVMEQSSKNAWNLEDADVKENTAPKLELYQHMTLSDQGLHILFPPYQVAPWAVGPITVTIPFEQLEDILKSKYLGETKTKVEAPKISQEKRDLTPYQGKKLIAFTFDDGPGYQTTKKLLDGLKERDARVTFFMLGSRVDAYPDIVKQAYLEGHQIGSHTYHHKNLFHLTDFEIHQEIESTNQAIETIIGVAPTLLRAPYGNTNDQIKKISNMYSILWDVDTLDWSSKNKDAISDHIVSHAHDGAVLLLHDIYNASIEGALQAMDQLKDEYAFVTVDEMLTLKGLTLDKTKSYRSFP